MGIRKHFEQQKPEDQDLKLQDLSLEFQESKDSKFDPKDFINLDEIMEMLQRNRKDHGDRLSTFQMRTVEFATIFPDEVKKMALNHDDLKEAKKQLKHCFGINDRYGAFRDAEFIKEFFPEEFDKLDLQGKDWHEEIESELTLELEQNYSGRQSMAIAASSLVRYGILFPEKYKEISQTTTLASKLEQNIKTKLEKSKKSKNVEWAYFVIEVASFRLLCPDEFKKLNIDNETIEKIKNQINSRKSNLLTKLVLLTNLAIILADKAEITDQGIKISSSETDFKQQKKPRPERKKF